jgi:hypothetical protein
MLSQGETFAGSKFRSKVFYTYSAIKETVGDTMGQLLANNV